MAVAGLGITAGIPSKAHASLFSFMAGLFSNQASAETEVAPSSKSIGLLKAAVNSDPNPVKNNKDITIIDDTSLLAQSGPTGSSADVPEVFHGDQIITYVVRSGDTLPEIAEAFNVSVNTIKIANEMSSSKVTEGQHLIILPVSGMQYKVKSGETLQSIATKHKVTVNDIMEYNNLEGSAIAAGNVLFIPTDLLPAPTPVAKPAPKSSVLAAPLLGGSAGTALKATGGFFSSPLSNYRKTQNLHGHNGVDMAAPVGTTIKAAAAGRVMISRSGWNGGYGTYVVIQHSNGTQTLYAHASKLLVSEGQQVEKGQAIALVGNTGTSTGAHLHFEVRGGSNPF